MIIFDFDGTIVDSLAVNLKCINLLAEKYDYNKIDSRTIKRKPFREVVIEDLKLSLSEVGAFIREQKMLLENNLDGFKIHRGIKGLLKKLSVRYKLGIVTSNSSYVVRKVLEKYSLNVFDFIHSDLALFGKERILKNYKGVYVADEVRDIIAARKAGIKIISVTWGLNSKELLLKNKPDFIVDKPKQIIEIVEKLF